MPRLLAAVLVLTMVAGLVAPLPAAAHAPHWGAFVAGGLTGLILGGALAAPFYAPPVVTYPYPYPYPAPPVYTAPPGGYAYPGAQPSPTLVYVPPQWVWNGYQWVWQQGYWRY